MSIKKRLEYLIKKFNIITDEEMISIKTDIDSRIDNIKSNIKIEESDTPDDIDKKLDFISQEKKYRGDYTFLTRIKKITSFSFGENPINEHTLYAYKVTDENTKKIKEIKLSYNIFSTLVATDTTKNKQNLQWLLTTIVRLIKTDIEAAQRFICEDLPSATEFLELFEENKKKRNFILWSKKMEYNKYIASNDVITFEGWEKEVKYNPSDITQYKSLSQLYDAISPYRIGDVSLLEERINTLSERSELDVVYRDKNFLIYTPYTSMAGSLIEKHSSFCTARKNNSMVTSYTQNHLQPNGSNSIIYIIIPQALLDNTSKKLYQIHFETNQISNQNNSNAKKDFTDNILMKNKGIRTFFIGELKKKININNSPTLSMSAQQKSYLTLLLEFGGGEIIFQFIRKDSIVIRIPDKYKITTIPDISKFTSLEQLIIPDNEITEIHDSVYNLKYLEVLSLPGNKIKTISNKINYMTNLKFINLSGNKMKSNIINNDKFIYVKL